MDRRSSLSERLYFIINIIMIFIYAGSGITLLLWRIPAVSTLSRQSFGVILLLYSFYRGFSLLRKTKNTFDEI